MDASCADLDLLTNKPPYCIGSEPEMHYQFKYLTEILRLQNETDLFGCLTNSRMSHDYINRVGGLDTLYQRFFHRLFADDILENTFLFFFGDHGLRFGPIRNYLIGKYEERLPAAYLIAPKRFLAAYPDMAANLRTNENRFTTQFDIHATMSQLVHFDGQVAKHSVRDRGISLFTEVPESRTCEDADVLPHWCVCHEETPVDVSDPMVQKATKALLQHINSQITAFPQCAVLELQTVFSAYRTTANQMDVMFKETMHDNKYALFNRTAAREEKVPASLLSDFTVSIETQPGSAMFAGTVRFNSSNENWSEITATVSRTNLYGNQSYCVDISLLKLYCYCTEQEGALNRTDPHA